MLSQISPAKFRFKAPPADAATTMSLEHLASKGRNFAHVGGVCLSASQALCAKAAVVAAGNDPKMTQLLQAMFKANAEELRTSKETFTGTGSVQAGTVLNSPSSCCNKRQLDSPQDWCHGRDTQVLKTHVFRNQVLEPTFPNETRDSSRAIRACTNDRTCFQHAVSVPCAAAVMITCF